MFDALRTAARRRQVSGLRAAQQRHGMSSARTSCVSAAGRLATRVGVRPAHVRRSWSQRKAPGEPFRRHNPGGTVATAPARGPLREDRPRRSTKRRGKGHGGADRGRASRAGLPCTLFDADAAMTDTVDRVVFIANNRLDASWSPPRLRDRDLLQRASRSDMEELEDSAQLPFLEDGRHAHRSTTRADIRRSLSVHVAQLREHGGSSGWRALWGWCRRSRAKKERRENEVDSEVATSSSGRPCSCPRRAMISSEASDELRESVFPKARRASARRSGDELHRRKERALKGPVKLRHNIWPPA